MPNRFRFRCWEADEKTMHYDVGIHGNKVVCRQDETLLLSAADNPVMQSTGLLDSKGKEIWEGDICKTEKGNRVVRYFAPDFALYKRMGLDLDTRVDCDDFSTPVAFEEVIGNVHENPELITK